MTTPPALHVQPETGPMLFADCPFCLGPMPLDAATGIADCPACAVRVELARDPTPDRAPAVEAPVTLAPAA